MLEIVEFETADLHEEEDLFDEEFEEHVLRMISSKENNTNLPQNLKIFDFLNMLNFNNPITPAQFQTNEILKGIDRSKYILFCKNEYEKLSKLVDHMNVHGTKGVSAKHLSEFYAAVNTYYCSPEFLMNCMTLFNYNFTEDHKHICFRVSVEIRKYLLDKKTDIFPIKERSITNRTMTDASHARVRYVGGYCVANVRHKYMKKKTTHMYKLDKEGLQKYKEAEGVVNILDYIKVDEKYALANTTNPDSMLDIERRQYKNHSLTIVSDDAFCFFLKLTEKCLNLLVDIHLIQNGATLFEFIRNVLVNDHDICESFKNLFNYGDTEKHDGNVNTAYKKILKVFLMVMVNQFRKDMLDSLNIHKKMAQRKDIRVSTASMCKGKVNSEDKACKKNPEKTPQYSCSAESHTTPNASSSTTCKSKETIDAESTIKTCQVQNCLTEKANQDSDVTCMNFEYEVEMGKKRKRQSENCDSKSINEGECSIFVTEICKICDVGQLTEQTQWIMCDCCHRWLHRNCAGLKNGMRWKKYSKKGANFICKDC